MKTNKQVLLTGGNGFIGRHLREELTRSGYGVTVTSRAMEPGMEYLDVLDEESICSVLQKIKPDFIMHLAGQSSVVESWREPQQTIETNVIGTINLLEVVRRICPESRVILFSTSHEYGPCEANVVSENQAVQPTSPYGISKATQTMLGNLYHTAYGLDVVTLRLFNQIGAGQSLGFVLPDFASQVAKIENGLQEPVIRVGNLAGIRDFSDIQDSVKQMACVMESGESGEIYHIGSGKGLAVKTLLDIILEEATVPIEVICKSGLRLQDEKIGYFADLTKLHQTCPEFSVRPIEETVKAVLNEWRQEYEGCD